MAGAGQQQHPDCGSGLYPTHAQLNLEQDQTSKGAPSSGLLSGGQEGQPYEGLRQQPDRHGDSSCSSPYFSDPDSLTLHITQASGWRRVRVCHCQPENREALEPCRGA